jgi:four helix bundle protein
MTPEDLSRRTKQFAVRIVRLSAALPRTREADVLGRQLLRSGTSVGANYREARRARSRPDFLSKVGVCAQEADETCYWLELLSETGIVKATRLQDLLDEARQLVAIFMASGRTASSTNRARNRASSISNQQSAITNSDP